MAPTSILGSVSVVNNGCLLVKKVLDHKFDSQLKVFHTRGCWKNHCGNQDFMHNEQLCTVIDTNTLLV